MQLRIPLIGIFTAQVLVVAAAFTAVIIIFTQQQSRDFKASLHERLRLQQANAMSEIHNPMRQRQDTFELLIQQFMTKREGVVFPLSTSTLQDSVAFHDHFSVLPAVDPTIQNVAFVNQSELTSPSYPDRTLWNAFMIDASMMGVVTNETLSACFGSFPMNVTACDPPPYSAYLNTAEAMGEPEGFTSLRMWGSPLLLDLGGNVVLFIAFTHSLQLQQPIPSFSLTFAIPHIKGVILRMSAHETSRSAIFTYYHRAEANLSDYFLVNGKVDFHELNTADTTNTYNVGIWRGGRTPDPILNEAFAASRDAIPHSTTGSEAFQMRSRHDGERYVVAAARKVDADTGFNWLFVEYSPHAAFYAAADAARMTGILIGIFCGLGVLASSLLIWLAIRLPLSRLHVSMGLAADMRNAEVDAASKSRGMPLLSEVYALTVAFLQMNTKLLRARPFLPQSLLAAESHSDEDDGDLDGAEDEDADGHSSRVRVGDDSQSNFSVTVQKQGVGGGMQRKRQAADARSVVSFQVGAAGKAASGGLALSRDLEMRRVAILSINVCGFHEGHLGPQPLLNNPASLAVVHRALARLIEQAVAEERGIVDYFHGDRFVCGFGTVKLCGNAARSAANASINIWARFQQTSSLNAGLQRAQSTRRHNYTKGGGGGSRLAQNVSNAVDLVSNHHSNSASDVATGGGAVELTRHSSTTAKAYSLHSNSNTTAQQQQISGGIDLTAAFPMGLAMGMSAGRAAVGNHGTDSMQRLGTIGAVYTEACRLQEAMSRRVLHSQRFGGTEKAKAAVTVAPSVLLPAVSVGVEKADAFEVRSSGSNPKMSGALSGHSSTSEGPLSPLQPQDHEEAGFKASLSFLPDASTMLSSVPAAAAVLPSSTSAYAPLLAGRCLVMGRTAQELDSTTVYCQVVGAVEARELMTSAAMAAAATGGGGGVGGGVDSLSQLQTRFATPRNLALAGLTAAVVNNNNAGRMNVTAAPPPHHPSPSNFNPLSEEDDTRRFLAPGSCTATTVLVAAAAMTIGSAATRRAIEFNTASKSRFTNPNNTHQNHNPSSDTNNTNTTAARRQQQQQPNTNTNEDDDEWLYSMQRVQQQHPFLASNTAITRLWLEGSVGGLINNKNKSEITNAEEVEGAGPITAWNAHVASLTREGSAVDEAVASLIF